MTENTPELVECPFCGGLSHCHCSVDTVDRVFYKVSCDTVGCIGSATNLWFPSEEQAIYAWNTRVFPSWLREKIEEFYLCPETYEADAFNGMLDDILSLTPEDKE